MSLGFSKGIQGSKALDLTRTEVLLHVAWDLWNQSCPCSRLVSQHLWTISQRKNNQSPSPFWFPSCQCCRKWITLMNLLSINPKNFISVVVKICNVLLILHPYLLKLIDYPLISPSQLQASDAFWA
jgi:hypothetical protein